MSKRKSKTIGANLPVPQSREDAAAYILRIGENNRDVTRIEADMNDQIAKITLAAEAKAAPLRDLITADTEGLKVWAEANRDALTNKGKTKTADLGTGKISWRNLPPKVSLRKVDEIIKALKKMNLKQFIRTKEEVDKEAMLKERDKASMVAGVTIGSEGEEFIVEPLEVEIARETGK